MNSKPVVSNSSKSGHLKPENGVDLAMAKELGWQTQLLEASVSSCVKEEKMAGKRDVSFFCSSPAM